MAMLNEYYIQSQLFIKRKMWIAITNVMHHYAFEADLIEVTKSMLANEYEIKLSKQDFDRDKTKGFRFWSIEDKRSFVSKHEYYTLPQKSKKYPNRFFYVIPESLLEHARTHAPAYAGIIVFTVKEHENEIGIKTLSNCRFRVARKAKLLKPDKLTDKEILTFARSLSFRQFKFNDNSKDKP